MQENGHDKEIEVHDNNSSLETSSSWYSRLNKTERIGAFLVIGGFAIDVSGVVISVVGIFNKDIAGLSKALEDIGTATTIGGVLTFIRGGLRQKGNENANNDNHTS